MIQRVKLKKSPAAGGSVNHSLLIICAPALGMVVLNWTLPGWGSSCLCLRKGTAVLTALEAPALVSWCLGERFLCHLSKMLSCAAGGGRETLLGSFPRALINITVMWSSALNLLESGAGGMSWVINLVLSSLCDVPVHNQTSWVELLVCASEKGRSRTQHPHADGNTSAWMPYSPPFCGDKISFK